MPLPTSLAGRLRLPVVAAPMFLASGPDLVTACCKAGVLGCFPALNQRTTEGFRNWLEEINARLTPADAPYGVNLIVHRSNPRMSIDLDEVVRYRVPVIITSLGAVRDVVDAVHSYGGLVFHDVIGMRHAEKAIAAGVDGLVLVCAGAGGHAGALSPFAFLPEVRAIFDGTVLLAGAISSGDQIAAARLMGADLVYMGTRFLATHESAVSDAYKSMITRATAADVIYTPAITGIAANFLRPSIVAAGLDPDHLQSSDQLERNKEGSRAQAWKDIWSAGQGIGSIADLPPAAEIVDRLLAEYDQALKRAVELPRCHSGLI